MSLSYRTLLVAALVTSFWTGCSGQDGALGPAGAAGPAGAKGEPGGPGTKGDPGGSGDAGKDWPGPVPAGYAAADGIKGGAAYSEWFAATAGGKGSLAQYSVTAGSDYVRCKSCHGWDGLGSAGSYAARTGISTGTASRADVSSANLRTALSASSYQELYDLIAQPSGRPMNAASDSRHPDYSKHLEPAQVWNLVKFMREEWVAPNQLYELAVSGAPLHYEDVGGVRTLVSPTLTYSNIGTDGDATAGKALYTTKCAACHGADGKLVPLEGLSLGRFVRTKPNESWFKIKFGQGTVMAPGLVSATADLKNLYKATANTTDFPD